MQLAKRLHNPQADALDEALAARITAHFTLGAAFPEGEANFSRFGHDAPAPTPLGATWALGAGERWLAHALGTYFFGLEARGEFKKAGVAEMLLSTQGLRFFLGDGGPEKPQGWLLAARGAQAPASKLEAFGFRLLELREVGSGDLLLLHFWRLEPLVLRVPWPRSLAAFVLGLRELEQAPRALEDSVISIGPKAANQVLDVRSKRS